MTYQSIKELHNKLRNREITSKNLISQSFDRIKTHDPKVKAFLSTFEESALEKADQVDKKLDRGDAISPLSGLPIAIKDNINILGQKTTCASKILENFVSPYNATVINKVDEHHLIPIGKTNMDEFAMGSSTENSHFFPTKNPWNSECVPGGSSGGSAAAVAAGFTPIALGSDTGGSVRQPASFCGVVGLKPTYGLVSRFGLVAYASSLDQIGTFSRTAEDAAYLLNCISGKDPFDSTSHVPESIDYVKALSELSLKDIKIGLPRELSGSAIDSAVNTGLETGLSILEKSGFRSELFSMEGFEYSIPTYYILAPAEASANLSRFDGVRFGYRDMKAISLNEMYKSSRGAGFGPEVKRRIILGTFALSSGYYDAYYLKAQKARSFIKKEFETHFKKYDIIMTPTSPVLPFKIGEIHDPLTMYKADIATLPVNLAGLPAISIPCGFSKDGLPIGMQLIGKPYSEALLLAVAHHFQSLTDFHLQYPKLGKEQN